MSTLHPTRILESALYVSDIERAKTFYGTVLGLKLIAEMEGRHAFYQCGNQMLLIFNPVETQKAIVGSPYPIPTHGTIGEGHVAFAATANEQDVWAKHLQEHGVTVEQKIAWDNGAKSIYFRDPSGNSLEFAESKLWF